MSSTLILTVTSFLAALVLTPACRSLALRFGIVDQPDRIRKFHGRTVARAGGAAIFCAYFAAFAMLVLLRLGTDTIARQDFDIIRRLFPSVLIIFLTGLLDDIVGLKPWQKLVAQFVAAFLVVLYGVQVSSVAWVHIPSWLGILATMLWLVGCTNAFNLIDGMDGLATGVGILATTTILIAAILTRNIGLVIASAPLAGALLGFLRYNFNPASIFLGDSGSLLTGFLLGCYCILWGQKSVSIQGLTAPLVALSIPLLDTGLAITRRFLRRQPIFGADRGHIHHKLLALGFTPRQAVIIIYTSGGLCGVLSLLQGFAYQRLGWTTIFVVCIAAYFGVERLGYAELKAAKRMILRIDFRRQLNVELELNTCYDKLSSAITPDQCWAILQSNYKSFGFVGIRLKLGGVLYTEAADGPYLPNTWTVRISLPADGYLNLSREFGSATEPNMARFADLCSEVLSTRALQIPRDDSPEVLHEIAHRPISPICAERDCVVPELMLE